MLKYELYVVNHFRFFRLNSFHSSLFNVLSFHAVYTHMYKPWLSKVLCDWSIHGRNSSILEEIKA